jgi:hypothetical protein
MQTMDGMGRSDTFLSAAACSDLANPDWPLQGQHLPGFGCPPPAASYLYEVRGHGVRERSQSRLRYRLEPLPPPSKLSFDLEGALPIADGCQPRRVDSPRDKASNRGSI